MLDVLSCDRSAIGHDGSLNKCGVWPRRPEKGSLEETEPAALRDQRTGSSFGASRLLESQMTPARICAMGLPPGEAVCSYFGHDRRGYHSSR